jgi:hypothetical protein
LMHTAPRDQRQQSPVVLYEAAARAGQVRDNWSDPQELDS